MEHLYIIATTHLPGLQARSVQSLVGSALLAFVWKREVAPLNQINGWIVLACTKRRRFKRLPRIGIPFLDLSCDMLEPMPFGYIF